MGADQLTIAEIREETALDMKELLKNLRPFIENDVLKVANGPELTPGALIIANDDFVKRGTTIKLMPTSQKDKGDGMIQREAAQRFQPSVPLIKKVIDILLEKNFIERK